MNQNELLRAALQSLLAHNEKVNHAFYVVGKHKAMVEAMSGQRELMQEARKALATTPPNPTDP
jgi:hypothetical protein